VKLRCGHHQIEAVLTVYVIKYDGAE